MTHISVVQSGTIYQWTKPSHLTRYFSFSCLCISTLIMTARNYVCYWLICQLYFKTDMKLFEHQKEMKTTHIRFLSESRDIFKFSFLTNQQSLTQRYSVRVRLCVFFNNGLIFMFIEFKKEIEKCHSCLYGLGWWSNRLLSIFFNTKQA